MDIPQLANEQKIAKAIYLVSVLISNPLQKITYVKGKNPLINAYICNIIEFSVYIIV